MDMKEYSACVAAAFAAVKARVPFVPQVAIILGSGLGDLAEAAATAKIHASEGFFQCAAESIQLHGGVGFTWEYDPHLYFKRARASEQFLGAPAFHREQLAKQIFGDQP